jgi:4-amino-4-deoxy-L-arabinose transferase-like glycosyltransferase
VRDGDRRFWRVLLLVALAALAVRVLYVGLAKHDEPVVGDQLFYNAEANRLADGDWFIEPFNPRRLEPGQPLIGSDPAADHPPLTVIVLAPVSLVTDDSLIAHRLTMTVIGVLTVLAIGVLGREIAGDRAGWLAAAIAAVYPYLWVNDGLVMSESLAALLVSLSLLHALRLMRAPSWKRALLLGALCALAGLTRAELLLLLPLLAVPAAFRARSVAMRVRWQMVGAAALAGAVLVLPWVGFNLARFDERTYISTNDGIALIGSNCESVYYGDGIGLTDLLCLRGNPRGDQSVDSEIYRERAFEFMSDHKSRVPIVALARVGRTWSVFRPWDMVEYNVGEGREEWLTAIGLFFYYPLVALAIGGVVVLWRRKDALWPLLVPVVIVTLASAATYGQTRFRVPAEPSLVVLAAVAGVALFDRARGRARALAQSRTIEASSSS